MLFLGSPIAAAAAAAASILPDVNIRQEVTVERVNTITRSASSLCRSLNDYRGPDTDARAQAPVPPLSRPLLCTGSSLSLSRSLFFAAPECTLHFAKSLYADISAPRGSINFLTRSPARAHTFYIRDKSSRCCARFVLRFFENLFIFKRGFFLKVADACMYNNSNSALLQTVLLQIL